VRGAHGLGVADAAAVYVALDAASLALAGLVALFFLRSHRLQPEGAFGVLAAAFGTLALSHLATAASGLRLLPGHAPAVDALRTFGVFLASVLVLFAYAARARAAPVRTAPILAGAAVAVLALVLALYLAGLSPLGEPLEVYPWLRLAETFLLLLAAAWAGVGVHARRLRDLQVPAAYVCLAMSRYSGAMLALHGDLSPSPFTYAWRLAALLLLAAVVARRWPRAPP
jgi:uncharacterized membrane protein YhaH (DUF805 family)